MNVSVLKLDGGLDRDTILKLYFYTKYVLIEKMHLTSGDLEVLVECFKSKGFTDKESKKLLVNKCIALSANRTEQSVLNAFSKITKLKLFNKDSYNLLSPSSDLLEEIPNELILLNLRVTNVNYK